MTRDHHAQWDPAVPWAVTGNLPPALAASTDFRETLVLFTLDFHINRITRIHILLCLGFFGSTCLFEVHPCYCV